MTYEDTTRRVIHIESYKDLGDTPFTYYLDADIGDTVFICEDADVYMREDKDGWTIFWHNNIMGKIYASDEDDKEAYIAKYRKAKEKYINVCNLSLDGTLEKECISNDKDDQPSFDYFNASEIFKQFGENKINKNQLFEARVFAHSSGFGLSGHYDYEAPEEEPLYIATETNEDDGELYFDETGCSTEFETNAKKFTSEEEALEFAKNNVIFGEPGAKLLENCRLNEKRIELPTPYPVEKDEIIDFIKRSSRLTYTAIDNKTIQIYIYSNGSVEPKAFAEVEIASVGYILHGAEGYDYQGNSLEEFKDDLKNVIFNFDATMPKRVKESINEGDKFKNKNGAVIEIVEYDEDENYVLYKVNDNFYDTHIDSIENILSKNGYEKLNESKFKSVENFGIHELEQQIKLFLKEDIGLSDNGQLTKRGPEQDPKPNSFYSISESGSIQGLRLEISIDGQYYDDIIIEIYSAQPVPMGCYEILLVDNETWLGKTFEEFKKDFYEAWKEIKSKPVTEETQIESIKESKRRFKESREDTIFDIANECSKILGVSKELPKFRIRNFGTDLVSYNGPKNTIFYHSDLLYISDETFVRTIIAHEMAHWAVGYEHNHDEVWVEAADRLEDSLGDKIYGIFENIDQYDLSDIFKGLEPGKVMKKFLKVYPEIENHYKVGFNTEFGDLVSYNNGVLTIRPTFYCANDTKYVTEDQWNIAGVEAETLIDEED